MKLFSQLLLVFSAIALLGCIGQPATQTMVFDNYSDSAAGIYFEKPANWSPQPDPLSLVRFGDLNASSFAVTQVPNRNASEFKKIALENYDSFSSNNAFSNISTRETTVSNFPVVEISMDQSMGTETLKNWLYIMGDTSKNRVVYLVFTTSDSKTGNEIRQRIIASTKIT